MLTVKELIDGLDVKVVAGEENLDRPVRWVHISELEDPTPWLSGGEFLLTTGIQLTSAAKQTAFVKQLAEKGAAGLGFGVGFDHETVPKAVLTAAEKHGLPVLEVPYDVPFIAITEKAFTWLVNEQYAVLRQALSGHAQLEQVVLNEGGLSGIAEVLATLIGCSVRIFGLRGELLVESAFNQPLNPETGAEIREQLDARLRAGHFDAFESHEEDLPGRTLVLPVPATGDGEEAAASPQAWLAAVKDSGGLSELDRLTFHQAITIVALELLRMRVAEDTEQRLAGNVLADIVSGDLLGNELARRLEPFGISDRVSAIVLAPEQPDPEVLVQCKQAVSSALRDEVSGALIATSGPLLCALTTGLDDKELHASALRLAERVTDETKIPVRIGIGRQTPSGQARRAYHEARWAIEARVLSANGNEETSESEDPVASYKDLGSFQLLLALQDDEALRLFCDSVLAPIEAGEGHYGDELLRSLEAFIEENGQWERAARRLYCHRHTLRYRVKKIEELTGRDLQSARDRIEFWLALRGRELVR